MLFTYEVWKTLCDAYIADETITITGCNSFSQEFETSGKIAMVREKDFLVSTTNPNAPMIGVTDDTIVLELGRKKDGQDRSNYCTQFVTELYADNMWCFIIKEIKYKKNGKTIYLNEDYQAIYDYCRETLITYDKQLLSQKITPATMDATCQKITHYVGKPINVLGNTGILLFVDITFKGQIMLYYVDFDEIKHITIPKHSTIVEGRILKITEPKEHTSFIDYLIDQRKKNKKL